MRKLICIDLDGTIIDIGNVINPEVFELLKDDSADYLICTGRPLEEVRGFGFNGDTVCANGAQVIRDNKVISSLSLEREMIEDVYKYLNDKSEYVTLATSHGRYVAANCDYEKAAREMILSFIGEDYSQEDFEKLLHHVKEVSGTFEDVSEVFEIEGLEVFKVEATVTSNSELYVKEIKELYNAYSFTSIGGHIEVVHPKVNKASGIKTYLNEEKRFIIAFGDGNNDLEMFKLADVSYAMGNATEQLKAVSTHVTESISEDGFILALKHSRENYKL